MKNMKKWASILLAVAMLASSCPALAHGQGRKAAIIGITSMPAPGKKG
ncbi:MAG: hypothetical protein FWG10_04190 [Eubacteriaceae bacterium]|nr:hypothetical protein [Eubacteriaceae bacterium]